MGNVYLNCLAQGDPGGVCALATAYYCPLLTLSYVRPVDCDRDVNIGRNTTGSETYINPDFLNNRSPSGKIYVFAHELGHTLRLAHHQTHVCVMNTNLEVTYPQSLFNCDLGIANPLLSPPSDPCNRAPEVLGIRCIFAWWRELGTLYDCFDADRGGTVGTSDISLAVAAFGGLAGENTYHPDTDVNFSGNTATDDISRIVDQFGLVCPPLL